MADVKTIDIDGVQWNLKDQEARNYLTVLEAKTNINEKVLAKKGDSFISLVTINDKKFINLCFKGDIIVSEIGQKILDVGVIEGITSTISVIAGLTRLDRGGRYPAVIDVTINGEVKVFPIISNQISGTIYESQLYGTCFIMI